MLKWSYYLIIKHQTKDFNTSEGGLSNASARLRVQDGAERGWGGGKPRLPHGKYCRVNFVEQLLWGEYCGVNIL